MRDKCIVFLSDNQAVVDIINKQTSKDRSVMVLLRHFVLCTLKCNILFHTKHIAGRVNHESDGFSHLQVEKFRSLAAYADKQPTPVPPGLLPNNWRITWTTFCTQPLPRVCVRLTKELGRHVDFSSEFCKSRASLLLVSVNNLALFISYLSAKKFASSTVSTYVSALCYVHKLANLPNPTKQFLVQNSSGSQ